MSEIAVGDRVHVYLGGDEYADGVVEDRWSGSVGVALDDRAEDEPGIWRTHVLKCRVIA